MATDTQLRQAFGTYATGVTVITCLKAGAPVGFTANSFTTVSLQPPLILFCVGRNRESFSPIRAAPTFCVNVLSSSQKALSNRFASSGQDKWEGVAYESDASGNPIFPDAAAIFTCRQTSVIDAGDHALILGEVIDYRHRQDAAPLVYCRSDYHSLVQAAA